jgi:bla regulator protein blaR1
MPGALIETLALALLHFLWEGLGVGLLAAAALRGGKTAQQRHLICLTAQLCCLLAPAVTALVVMPHEASLASPRPLPLPSSAIELSSAALQASAFNPLYAAVILWLVGALSVAAYYIVQWVRVQRIRLTAFQLEEPAALLQSAQALLQRWQQTARVAVKASHAVLSPIVVGVVRPVIIFPAALLARMSVAEFELILLHEVAHIVRRDTWANALQILLEILLFYHPVVHWLSRRARLERECACDDFAVAASGTPYEYARALTALAFRPVTPLGLGASGGDLLHRLRHLAGDRAEAEAFPRSPAHLLLIAVLLACILLMRQPLLPELRPAPAHLAGSPQARAHHSEPSLVLSEARENSAPPRPAATPSVHAGAEVPASQRSSSAQDHDAASKSSSQEVRPTGGEAPVLQASPSESPAPPTARAPDLAEPANPRQTDPMDEAPAARDAPPGAEADPVLTPIYDPPPEYPLEARRQGLQGSVVVMVRVNADGRPSGLQILKASPQGVFEGAVRRALMRWRYRVHDGELTAAYRLTFTLAGVSSSPASICATATASRTCDGP